MVFARVIRKDMIICGFPRSIKTRRTLGGHRDTTLLGFIIKRDTIMPKLPIKTWYLDGKSLIPNKTQGVGVRDMIPEKIPIRLAIIRVFQNSNITTLFEHDIVFNNLLNQRIREVSFKEESIDIFLPVNVQTSFYLECFET